MRTIRRRNPSDQSDVNWGRGMFIAGATRIAPYKGPYAEDLLKRVPYPEFCRHPAHCVDKAACPRNPACND